jgi:Skp family chaperone for outer membrane proteins
MKDMKKVFLATIGFCLLGAISGVNAQGSDLKIAYVNMAKAIETSTHAESVLAKLKSEFDPK